MSLNVKIDLPSCEGNGNVFPCSNSTSDLFWNCSSNMGTQTLVLRISIFFYIRSALFQGKQSDIIPPKYCLYTPLNKKKILAWHCSCLSQCNITYYFWISGKFSKIGAGTEKEQLSLGYDHTILIEVGVCK